MPFHFTHPPNGIVLTNYLTERAASGIQSIYSLNIVSGEFLERSLPVGFGNWSRFIPFRAGMVE